MNDAAQNGFLDFTRSTLSLEHMCVRQSKGNAMVTSATDFADL